MIHGEITTSSFNSLIFAAPPCFILFVRTTPVGYKSPVASTEIGNTGKSLIIKHYTALLYRFKPACMWYSTFTACTTCRFCYHMFTAHNVSLTQNHLISINTLLCFILLAYCMYTANRTWFWGSNGHAGQNLKWQFTHISVLSYSNQFINGSKWTSVPAVIKFLMRT